MELMKEEPLSDPEWNKCFVILKIVDLSLAERNNISNLWLAEGYLPLCSSSINIQFASFIIPAVRCCKVLFYSTVNYVF